MADGGRSFLQGAESGRKGKDFFGGLLEGFSTTIKARDKRRQEEAKEEKDFERSLSKLREKAKLTQETETLKSELKDKEPKFETSLQQFRSGQITKEDLLDKFPTKRSAIDKEDQTSKEETQLDLTVNFNRSPGNRSFGRGPRFNRPTQERLEEITTFRDIDDLIDNQLELENEGVDVIEIINFLKNEGVNLFLIKQRRKEFFKEFKELLE